MNTFFCAEASYQAGEDLIGNAWPAQIFVLVECPPPWAPRALESKSIPVNLKALNEEIDQRELDVTFLLIYSDKFKQEDWTRFLILRQQVGFSAGYSKQEFFVPDISDIAPALQDYLAGREVRGESIEAQTRDILVCTHGGRDKCCAKYGLPFYRQALAAVADLSFSQVRIWHVSHIGEHRFAPTIIDFPEGRYYGRLDSASFTSILTRTGDIQCLSRIYRGHSILPCPVQILERELILMHGWDWFSYKITAHVLEQTEDESFNRIELAFKRLDGSSGTYRAEVVEDESKALDLRADCGSSEAYEIPQYFLKNLVML